MIDELSMDGEFLSIFGKFKIPKIYEVVWSLILLTYQLLILFNY